MPRKLIKKYLPNEQRLKASTSLKWITKYIQHPFLWHLSRKSVSRAFFVGVFCAFLPIPLQMLLAAILAVTLRSNLAISVSLVWITNPLTIPPIFYFTYKMGILLLGATPIDSKMAFTYQFVTTKLAEIWLPLITGSLFCAIIFGAIAYLAVNILWIWQVKRNWRKRHRKKRDK